jgi:extracellular elastinolytic metalloproteinase
VLYHEYTHGLSSRLVTYDDGSEALNRPQSGAMGEGWSDWYAQDFLVREGLVTDTPGTDGDVDMGRYTDSTPHSIRTQAIDCAVGSTNAAACPGGGGYTFGDFAKIAGGAEVHSDGEIWVQTLWQLREALVAKLGSDDAGSDAAERIITDAMRLSVPEPSYLDMRNAILAADLNAYGGADHDLIWQVFATRGMGFYAATDDSSDTRPTEDFSVPPPPSTQKGSITGTVTDRQTGAPLANVAAGVVGLDTDIASTETHLTGSSDAAGHYTIPSVPAGAYPRIGFRSPAGYDRTTIPATVPAGQAATANAQLTRDWAASAGGTSISTTDDSGAPFGCGAAALIDQSQPIGWSATNPVTGSPPPTATLRLPQATDITSYAIDPANTCNDDATATLKGYRLETSPDGVSWTVAAQGAFTAAQAGTLVPIAAAAGNAKVRFVRLTLLSSQGTAAGTSGADFVDVSELNVYGSPSPADNGGGGGGGGGGNNGGGGTPTPTTTQQTPPPPPPKKPAPAPARATFVLPRTGTKGAAKLKITCKTTCRASATLTVTTATMKRYKLRSTTVGRLTAKTFKGTKTLTVTLTADARKRLRARHAKKLRVTIHATATMTAAKSPKTTKVQGATLKL